MRAVATGLGTSYVGEKLFALSTVVHSNPQKEKVAKRKRNSRRRLSSSLQTTTKKTTLNQASGGPNNWEPLDEPCDPAITLPKRMDQQELSMNHCDGFCHLFQWPGMTRRVFFLNILLEHHHILSNEFGRRPDKSPLGQIYCPITSAPRVKPPQEMFMHIQNEGIINLCG